MRAFILIERLLLRSRMFSNPTFSDRVPSRMAGCLAGNSIHADKTFLVKEMPEVSSLVLLLLLSQKTSYSTENLSIASDAFFPMTRK